MWAINFKAELVYHRCCCRSSSFFYDPFVCLGPHTLLFLFLLFFVANTTKGWDGNIFLEMREFGTLHPVSFRKSVRTYDRKQTNKCPALECDAMKHTREEVETPSFFREVRGFFLLLLLYYCVPNLRERLQLYSPAHNVDGVAIKREDHHLVNTTSSPPNLVHRTRRHSKELRVRGRDVQICCDLHLYRNVK